MFKNRYEQIYVVCPASARTGGLELLHQLVFSLNEIGIKANIAYTQIKEDNPINPAYTNYVNEYTDFEKIEDKKGVLIIFSELQIELIKDIKNAEVAVWWLSVDNYLKVYNIRWAFKLLGLKGILWYIKNNRWKYRISKIKNKIKYNFAQSYYAIDFLKRNNFSNIHFLSDYINTDYLYINNMFEFERNNVVLYNPKKGLKYTKKLMKLAPDLKWIALINMTNEQVKKTLLTSKVYIDFGNHPGKDRFPREAAVCGCCIITDKKGSARFYGDVPIDEKYKFEDNKSNRKKIIECIKSCLDDYQILYKDFDNYRKMIKNEYIKFNQDVKKIFLD